MPKTKIIAILFILFLLLIIFMPNFLKLQKLKITNQDLTGQIKKLKIENTKLINEVKKLKQDPVYIEEVARKKMKMSKKGEIIYKLVPAEAGNNGR